MFRFFHSADWQLGARFRQFGARAERLRAARLETLGRALGLAVERGVGAFLVAGDLFEDNQVDDVLVESVVALFAKHEAIEIYLLPGNHDPFTGPDSVWRRKAFADAPPNVHVLAEAGATKLAEGVWLLASPLRQKVSTTDPSLELQRLAGEVPADAVKIGLTHGALAIEGKHQENDFPIALDAASRAGLDYLGIGHWHNWLADTDGGRIVMPGTPEPDQFGQARSGQIAAVEIAGRGARAAVEPVEVASLKWREFEFDFLAADSSRTTLELALAGLRADAAKTVLRVVLRGAATPQAVAEVRGWLGEESPKFLTAQVVDATRVRLSAAELGHLRERHPILAQVLADMDQLELLATGESAGGLPDGPSGAAEALSLAEAQGLLAGSKIELAELDARFFGQLRQIAFQTLQEVAG
ncbi:MAG: DNA repair exonuclease [Chthoniobacterales bacterium]